MVSTPESVSRVGSARLVKGSSEQPLKPSGTLGRSHAIAGTTQASSLSWLPPTTGEATGPEGWPKPLERAVASSLLSREGGV